MHDRNAAKDFFETLYSDGDAVHDKAQIVIWAHADAPNRWCSSIEEALDVLSMKAYQGNSYFGLALQNPDRALEQAKIKGDKPDLKARRGYAQSVAAWPGVGLDIDIRVDGKNKRYPPTLKDAHWLVNQLPIKPSLIVETGGGLHAYWLMEEAMPIDNTAALEQVRRAAYGIYLLALNVARDRDWAIDNTSDLARVLRVPGTLNEKYKPPVEVKVIEDTGARYDIDAIEIVLPINCSPPANESASHADHEFIVDEDAAPPMRKLELAIEMDARFALTWTMRRKDLDSHSEYDLSLANQCLSLGWSDQETVDAMIYHRAKHNGTPKLRPQYYASRLALARSAQGLAGNEEVLERLVERGSSQVQASAEREMTIDDINQFIELSGDEKIESIIRYAGDPPTYKLKTHRGQLLNLGPVRSIIAPHLFREAIAASTGMLIKRVKDKEWAKVAQAILRCTTNQDIGPDATPGGEMRDALVDYLEDLTIKDGNDLDDRGAALRKGSPFTVGLRVHVTVRKLRDWLRMHNADRRSKNELCQSLKEAGAETGVIRYRINGRAATKRTWSIETELLERDGTAIKWPEIKETPF